MGELEGVLSPHYGGVRGGPFLPIMGELEGVLHSQDEVVGPQDAAVAEPPRLPAGSEHDEAGGVGPGAVGIYGECHALLATDDIAIGGRDVPDAPRNALDDFCKLTS